MEEEEEERLKMSQKAEARGENKKECTVIGKMTNAVSVYKCLSSFYVLHTPASFIIPELGGAAAVISFIL